MTNPIIWIPVATLVLLIVLAQLFAERPQAYPYEKKETLFTSAERAFLYALEQSVGNQYRITGKVRLGDIIHVRKGLSPSQQVSARNRINQKHIDFVLCDPRTLKIVGVIELDDRSHEQPERRKRDEFVDRALAASSVPILHVKVQRSYDVHELRNQIREAFLRNDS